ncbi:hypothetical protein AVME950_02115 [Acidovorax sp. SUPP950]|uniref:hypothetical protein n=1 Tax=Acidovorax sp. SUPP950 TaxID=511901 RepID=UPI0023D47CD5|nr:hypothetical protein [Acidovorax sp. SUPP950]GKS73641.1 hypothetical protein AVME950_02115 [Acidovorax sp. SUPP950]
MSATATWQGCVPVAMRVVAGTALAVLEIPAGLVVCMNFLSKEKSVCEPLFDAGVGLQRSCRSGTTGRDTEGRTVFDARAWSRHGHAGHVHARWRIGKCSNQHVGLAGHFDAMGATPTKRRARKNRHSLTVSECGGILSGGWRELNPRQAYSWRGFLPYGVNSV